jgi:Flp pilus assembly pilin Flp
MGIVKKAVKTVGKGITRVVKGVAKGIKKVGKGIAKGVKGVVKGFGKLMGKLGPLGTIALSFALPGIGAALGSLWTSASAYLPTAFVNAVNTGVAWASNAVTAITEIPGKVLGKLGETTLGQSVKTGFNTITEKISGAFEYVGGSIKEGASNMFQSAKEMLGMPKTPADPGAFIGKGAEKMMVDKAVAANPEFLKMANASGTTVADIARSNPSTFILPDVTGPIANTQSFNAFDNPELAGKAGGKVLDKQASFLTQKTGQDVLNNNPEFLRMAGGNIEEATSLANQQNNFIAERSGIAAAANFSGQAENVKDMGVAETGILDRVKKALPTLGSSPIPQAPGFIAPMLTGDEIENTTANRFGVGGTGSAGGQFLDPTILAMIQQQQRQLEAEG